jgi:hypothetical protein
MSLPVTEGGCMVMTLKPNNSPTLEESCFASPQESTTAACFFDHQDILYHEFAPEGQTIN